MKSALSCRSGRYENEASRRLYRGAAEIAQRLDHTLNQATNFVDLFSTEVIELRTRLKDYCERLIFTDPVEYGKKAEDLLWRKVFYEFFQKCKQNKKKLLESDCYLHAVHSHLLSAIGSYHHMMLRIQTEYHVNVEGKVDSPFLWQLKGMKKERWRKYQQSAAADRGVQMWANQAIHRILIYLGDLARYVAELNNPDFAHMSERYYLQAFCLNYKNGMPHNQLGSLANNRFDSAYHYMRCLASVEKFDGAEGNLMKVFDKNNKVMEELNLLPDTSQRTANPSHFVTKFLKLCEIFYFSSDEHLPVLCQELLHDFDICMQPSDKNVPAKCQDGVAAVSTALKSEMVFKVSVMSLMCITRLNERGSSDVSAATAFILALFSSLVHSTYRQLLVTVFEYPKVEEIAPKKEAPEILSVLPKAQINYDHKENYKVKNDNNAVINTENVKKNKKSGLKKLRKLRRRRKMSSTSQEDSEISDAELNDLLESDEENCINSDISETGSCSSDSLSEHDEEDIAFQTERNTCRNESISDENGHNEISIGISEDMECLTMNQENSHSKNNSPSLDEQRNLIENVILPPKLLFDVLSKTDVLRSLKVLVDWLRSHRELLSVCAESSNFLIPRLLELLNLLIMIETQLLKSKEKYSSLLRIGNEWKQTLSLPEDVLLMYLPALDNIHSHLSFDVTTRRTLSINEQIFLRIQCFLSFGDLLTEIPESLIAFDRHKNQFFLKDMNKAKDISNNNNPRNDIVNNKTDNPKQKLMHDMAHLWLKAEVNNLEMIVENSSTPQLSPLLVTDTSALCHHLPLLKQLVAAKSFIVIIPRVVIDNLDQIKRKSIGAREAIRWLEFIFKKGTRHIRAQRDAEKATLQPIKYPRKKEKDAWDFFQILECCHYLVQQQSSGKMACSLVTLLVGTKNHLPGNASALARSLNVSMENLETFFSKWQSSPKNPG